MKIKFDKGMSSNYEKYFTLQDRVSLFCFSISILLGVWVHFIDVLPAIIDKLLIISTIGFGYCGILIFFISQSNRLYSNKVFNLWIILATYMMVIGVLFSGGSWKSSVSLNWLALQDLRYVMYSAIGFAFANKKFINSYHKLMKLLGVLSIVFGVLALVSYKFDIGMVKWRLGVWDMPYYYWWLSTSIFAYHFSFSRITGRDKLIGYGTFATYVIMGLLFLKRSVLINVLFLIVITALLKPIKINLKNKILSFLLKVIIITGILSIVFLLFRDIINDFSENNYFGKAISATFKRFNIDSITSYDRADEANLYFNSVPVLFILIGRGLGNYYIVGEHVYNALHIGFYNLIYKGGAFYLLFWLYIVKSSLKKFFIKKQLSDYTLVCLCVTLSATLSLLYEFSFTYTILPIGYATSIAYLIQTKE